MDSRDFDSVFEELEERKICFKNSVLYETCAVVLEAIGRLTAAQRVYRLGISRSFLAHSIIVLSECQLA